MSDENTPKDEQSAQRDRKLLDDAWRQVEEARQRANETDSSDRTVPSPKAGPDFDGPPPDSFAGYKIVREIHRGGQGVDGALSVAARIENLREAQPLLLEGYEGMRDHPEATDVRKRGALQRIVKLYEAWDLAEPGQGYAEKAAEWRAELPPPETPAASQPVPEADDTNAAPTSQPSADGEDGNTEP